MPFFTETVKKIVPVLFGHDIWVVIKLELTLDLKKAKLKILLNVYSLPGEQSCQQDNIWRVFLTGVIVVVLAILIITYW